MCSEVSEWKDKRVQITRTVSLGGSFTLRITSSFTALLASTHLTHITSLQFETLYRHHKISTLHESPLIQAFLDALGKIQACDCLLPPLSPDSPRRSSRSATSLPTGLFEVRAETWEALPHMGCGVVGSLGKGDDLHPSESEWILAPLTPKQRESVDVMLTQWVPTCDTLGDESDPYPAFKTRRVLKTISTKAYLTDGITTSTISVKSFSETSQSGINSKMIRSREECEGRLSVPLIQVYFDKY
eukprot:GHVN01098811.1.p1 GENE.GHVN01098811.1~~GHVN01098811.1.p1  ORF type:complete len:244 (+),score=30.37 GHVN01098811.1:417-1148(+)